MTAHPVVRNLAGAPHPVSDAVAAHERHTERLQPSDELLVKLSDLKLRERAWIFPELTQYSLLLLLCKWLKLQRGSIV